MNVHGIAAREIVAGNIGQGGGVSGELRLLLAATSPPGDQGPALADRRLESCRQQPPRGLWSEGTVRHLWPEQAALADGVDAQVYLVHPRIQSRRHQALGDT